MKKLKVIVFGATGGVGAYTTIDLIANGYDVIAVGHRDNDNNFYEAMGTKYFSVDIRKSETFDLLPKDNVFAIIHLAGMLPARMKDFHPQQYIDMNVSGTLNVLEYAVKVKAKRFVYAQSWSDLAYMADQFTVIPVNAPEKFPLDNDHSVYAITKNAAMHLCEHYALHYGFRLFSLRFPNIYLYNPNPYYYVDGQLRRQGFRNILRQIMNGEDIELWGNPLRVRDMVYVKDCVQIIECCLTTISKGGTYNVGTGIGITREEQIQGLIDVFSPKNKPKPHIIFNREKPDSPQYIMDVSKTKSELGYKSKYDYIHYLEDYKKEMQENRFAPIWGKPEDFE